MESVSYTHLARPTRISYVPISDEELDEKVVMPTKKKHKGLKVTGIVAAMLVVTAGCAYGAASYYYACLLYTSRCV